MTKADILINDIDNVLEMYRNGLGTVEIGKKYSCNCGIVYRVLQDYLKDNEKRKRSSRYGKMNDLIGNIIELKNMGYSAYKISLETGIPKTTVLRTAKRHGISFEEGSSNKNPLKLKDRMEEVKNLSEKGLSVSEIAKTLGYGIVSIYKALDKLSIKPNSNMYFS